MYVIQGDGLKLTFHKRAKEKERRQAESLEADKGNVMSRQKEKQLHRLKSYIDSFARIQESLPCTVHVLVKFTVSSDSVRVS